MNFPSIRLDECNQFSLFLLSLACMSSLGWVFFYPYSGYTTIILLFTSIVVCRQSPVVIFYYSLISCFFISYIMWPREYGGPSNAQYISALLFFYLAFLDKGSRNELHLLFVKIVIISCVLAILVMVSNYFIPIPSVKVDEGPQVFNIYSRLYVERVNITIGDLSSLVGFIMGQRFHGGFFEPGFLGVILGIGLYSKVSGIYRILIYLFGLMTLSMAFIALCFIHTLSLNSIKNRIFYIFSLLLIVFIYYYLGDPESFFYRSIFERFLGTGDKVLNTRNSFYEQEQISLFWNVVLNDMPKLFFGVGFDVPGSGGSYRVWILGVGLLGTIIYFAYFLINILTLKYGKLSRIVSLLLVCYLFGFWLMPFFVFLMED